MRDVINKNVTEEQLLQTAERVFSRGVEGDEALFHDPAFPPTEEEEDVREIESRASAGARARSESASRRARGARRSPKVRS